MLPWLLPGTSATHRSVEALAVSVVALRRGRITSHRTLWDQHAMLTRSSG